MSSRYTAPCKDCPDRSSGCHASCEQYLEYKQYRQQLSDTKRKATMSRLGVSKQAINFNHRAFSDRSHKK